MTEVSQQNAWKGELPSGWQVIALDKAIDPVRRITYGIVQAGPPVDDGRFMIRGGDYSTGWVTPEEILRVNPVVESRYARARVRPGDVVLTIVGAGTGNTAVVPEWLDGANLTQTTARIAPNSAVAAGGFLSYLLQSRIGRSYADQYMKGAAQPGLNLSHIAKWRVPVPPLPTQKAIADFLDTKTEAIDALIEKKQKLLTLLAEKRAALINQAVTKGLDPNAAMKDSGIPWIGEIPAHWEVNVLKRLVATRITDGPHETPEFVDDGIPFVSANAISKGRIHFDKRRGNISPELHATYCRKCRPQRDDIFMVKSGATTGKLGIVETDAEFSVWSPLALIRCNTRKILPKYVFQALSSESFQRQVQTSWSYGTQPNIGMSTLENLIVAAPPLREQHEIADILQEHDGPEGRCKMVISSQLERLQEYRQALITAAVTGQLDIGEAA